MSQVSLPMRIALAATLAFFALWFVALRPKPPAASSDPATPPTPAAAQSAPGKAAAQAQQAVDASNQSGAKHEQAAGAAGADATAGAATGTGTAAAPTQDAAKKPSVALKQSAEASKAALDVIQDLVRGKVVVLLFWDSRLSDDRAVHGAVTGLDRRGGKVAVHLAAIRNLALYEPITRGVPVVTSPTVLVIDRAGRARSVGGLSVRDELDELVGKALKVKP